MVENRQRLVGRVVASIAGLIVLVSPPAFQVAAYGATQSSLQAQVASITSQISNQSVQIHQLAVSRSVAQSQLVTLNAQLAGEQKQLASASATVGEKKGLLAKIAISQYMNLNSASSVFAELSMSQADFLARTEYERVMGLDVSSAIASYNASLKSLDQSVSATKRLQQAVVAEEAQIDNESTSLSHTITSEQKTLSSVNGQIQQLVQQQLAQQLAAAAKASKAKIQANIQSQGVPSANGISQTPTNGGQVGNWGGHPAPVTSAALSALRNCESGGNYQDDTGNGYYGAYQFSVSTWQGMGYPGIPSDAPPSLQDQAASRLAANGWYSWPECALLIGLN